MITEAHNYTLIDTWIHEMGNECNPGMKGQYTLPPRTRSHKEHVLWPTRTHLQENANPHTCTHADAPTGVRALWWRRHIFLSGCKVNVKCMVGNDDMRVWKCELDGGAPYGSLRPCHYLVTPLTSIQQEGEREREREWRREREGERESPKTVLQLKLSGVNSAIITLKCQPAIKYNSSSGRKQISFDHAVITLSCRTIRRDQIFTFSVWGKAIRVHSTWQGCTFAILQG